MPLECSEEGLHALLLEQLFPSLLSSALALSRASYSSRTDLLLQSGGALDRCIGLLEGEPVPKAMHDLLDFAILRILAQVLPELGEEARADIDDVAAFGEETTSKNVKCLRDLVSVLGRPNILGSKELDQVR